MKRKEKIMIIALIAIAVVAVMWSLNRKKEINNNIGGQQQNNIVNEENVDVLEDGTKLNTSSKFHQTKNFDGMEISNFQLTSKNNVTQLLGTITNKSQTTKGGYAVNIKIVDKSGKTIITVAAYIGELRPGESAQLSTSATFDYANAYDFSISKR